jgi:hypothetical protein
MERRLSRAVVASLDSSIKDPIILPADKFVAGAGMGLIDARRQARRAAE